MQIGGKTVAGRAALAPVVVAMLVMVVWGATPVLTRIATDGIPPVLVAVGRTVIAGVVALPLLLVSRQSIAPSGRPRMLLVASSLTGFVVFPLLYTVGQQRTSAMHGAIILAALPVFTGLYAALVARRTPGRDVGRGLCRGARRRSDRDRDQSGLRGRTRRSSVICSCWRPALPSRRATSPARNSD